MNSVNSLIRALDSKDPQSIPDLRQASIVAIGSDYSGQHAASEYEAFAFVIADLVGSRAWAKARQELREKLLSDGRRFSYKALSDRRRSRALPQFLDAIDLIPGLLAVVVVNKAIPSLFKSSGRIEASDPMLQSIGNWAPHIAERLLRVCHFVAFFLAGISGNLQDLIWITDQDDIVANDTKHAHFVSIFRQVSSHYLSHALGHVRIATTAGDTGKRDVEDFVAIADFAAGAVCETLNAYHRTHTIPLPRIILPIPKGIDEKALRLIHWFSDRQRPLKRLVIGFEPEAETTRVRVRHYLFEGTSGHIA
jgi:hypothetical protein